MRTSDTRRIVIVGHGIAGLTAGDALRQEGFDGELVVVGQERHDPYSRPALSKAMLSEAARAGSDGIGRVDDGDDVHVQYLPTPDHGAEVLAGSSAVGLDPRARNVLLDDGRRLSYDGLVVASGARARRLTDHPDEFTLRGLDDARALRRRLADRPHVTVVGGGPLGMEVASGAREFGCEVTLVHRGRPMERHVGAYLSELCTAAARDHGVRVVDGTVAEAHRRDGAGLELELTDGQRLSADVVVSAVGDLPNDAWLAGSGLLSAGRAVTDAWGFLAPGVVAAGDVAWRHTDVGPRRRALWTDAIEQAKAAAAALLHGTSAAPSSYTPYFWTEQFGLNLRICGEIPGADLPQVVDGDVDERRALFRWDGLPNGGAAASLNFRIPIPRLRRLATATPVAA